MPHSTIKLIPGVDTNKTPTLNETAISFTDLVRFVPDRTGLGLVQKLGGWTRYISGTFSAPIRELKAWSDLEYTNYLAIGGESDVGVQVYKQSDGSLTDVTPRTLIDDVTSSFVTTSAALPSTSSHTDVRVATSTEALGPELVTNGNFATGIQGWTVFGSGATLSWDAINQRAEVTTTAQQQGLSTTVSFVSGDTYLVTATITNGSSSSRTYRAVMGTGVSDFVTISAGATQNVSFTIPGATSSTLTLRTGGTFTPDPNEKQYFDNISAKNVRFPTTYNNGTSGVGATLTNAGPLAAIQIDGVSLAVSNRVLVQNQVTPAHNGVYSVTTVGDGSTAWVLTRVTDFDAWGTGDIEYGALFFVSEGTVNASRTYYCSNSTTVTVGTTAITFALAAGLSTGSGASAVSVYTPFVPSSASYVFFPTIVNLGNVNLLGPYDITTIGSGFFTIDVPSILTPISKITAVTAGSDRTVTIRFPVAHTFYVGQSIYVAGVDTVSFDGSFTITSVTDVTITYTQTGVSTAATSYGGTVNAKVNFGGVPPEFTTVAGSSTVTVDLVNHGYSVGDTFNATVSTTVGGAVIFGLYTINKINTADQFEISTALPATGSATGYENGGAIRIESFVSIQSIDQGDNYVYGGGVYNEGLYGSGFVPAANDGTAITATDWSLDNWGSILVAAPKNGAVYYWQPVGSAIQNLGYMPNAPVYNAGIFVAMPQRQVIAFGSSFGSIQDPLLIRWCDLEDFTVWEGTAFNQAGSYRIPTGSKIVWATQAPQQALIWTDLDVWSMTYIGQPYIYGFNKIGANAGLISAKAAGQMGGVVYWMSQKQFFRFGGNGVEPIPCPVWDQVFQNFFPGVDGNGNPYTDRIRCAANSQYNEITWYFPAHYTNDIDPATGLALDAQQIGTGEVNAYVKYNVVLNQWDYGYQHPDNASVLVGRTAWIDQSVLGPPIGAAAVTSVVGQTSGFFVYQHETSNNADGVAMQSGFTTGYAALSDGNEMIFIDQVWPDMKWGFVDEAKTAEVKITFFVTNYPGDTPIEYGPYTVTQQTQYLSVRMRGRLVAIGVSSTDSGSFWRIGAIRYRFQPDGKY